MSYVLTDGAKWETFLPFTYTRPIAEIRVGILTLREKWEKHLGETTSTLSKDYLSSKYPAPTKAEGVVIDASFLPTKELVEKIKQLAIGHALMLGETIIAYRTNNLNQDIDINQLSKTSFVGEVLQLEQPWDIFSKNGDAIEADFELLTKGRKSAPLSTTNTVINPERIFVEEGATIECSILNASTGPIYVGSNAEIMEGSIVRGGLALCANATLKMGSKIYGPTTIGPHCKVGGEVSNSVLFAYSNKGHEGFLGNSVLGEWCNLGADTNTSNLKNNYAPVRLWNYGSESFAETGLQFCGLLMGDHSKTGINTMFNTGTVVGVSANVFGSGYPRNFIPSFSWGGASGFTKYRTDKAFEAAKAMMGRRKVPFDTVEQQLLETVFERTKKWRKG